jgi:DNA-binding transcriptional regulator LsrR (DeoR family)
MHPKSYFVRDRLVDVEIRQLRWNRRHAIRRALAAGAKQTELADKLGITQARVHQLNKRAIREITWRIRSSMEEEYEEKDVIASISDAIKFYRGVTSSSKLATEINQSHASQANLVAHPHETPKESP